MTVTTDELIDKAAGAKAASVVLAQASMARVLATLPEGAVAAPVFSSPELGVTRARDVLASLQK